MADFLFSEFPTQNINGNQSLVLTSGRTTKGIATGSYISDTSADAALMAAHPRFVARSSNGRYFRALPQSGRLAVELGGAIGDGTTNDQPAIQAAIAYAEAIGVRRIQFGAKSYRLHCPVRTSDPAWQIGQHAYDGRPIVISTPMVFESICPGGTRLSYRHTNGADRQSNWQVVYSPSISESMVWRGGGLFVRCPSVAPVDPADRPGITLIDMTLDGGIPQGSVWAWPARLSDGEGWDVSDKGVEFEPDRYSGDVRLIRSKITGFRGELIYQAGEGVGEIYIRSAELSHTNGVLIQAGGTNIDVEGLYGHHAFATFEGWSGRRGRMVETLFEDCVQTGGIEGGLSAPGSNRNAPRRFADDAAPWLLVDAEFNNCGPVFFGSWTRGRLRLTDSYLLLDGEQIYGEGLSDIDLEVISKVDKIGGRVAVVLLGSAIAGKQTLSDVRIRLSCTSSEQARINGLLHLQPVDYRGSMGPNVVVEQSNGIASRGSGPSTDPITAVPDHFPCFRSNVWHRTTSSLAGILQDIVGNPLIVPRADFMAVYADAPGTWPITLPTTGIQEGHELTIRHVSGGNAFTSLAASGAGAALAAMRVLGLDQQIRLRFDAALGAWREVAAPRALIGSANPAMGEIAAGSVSPEFTVPVPGAATGMAGWINPQGDAGSDLEICAIRVVSGAVKFRLRNLAGSALTPSALPWKATATYVG